MKRKNGENRTREELLDELEQLRYRLDEAEQTLEAIRSGDVDALVVAGPHGDQIFSLTGSERVYRQIIETMNEGALTVGLDGTILFCNQRFCDLLRSPMADIIGRNCAVFSFPSQLLQLKLLLVNVQAGPEQRYFLLRAADGTAVPVNIAASMLVTETDNSICLVVSDLTVLEAQASSIDDLLKQKHTLEVHQAELYASNEELSDSQQAALNLVEDLEIARRMAEEANKELQQEIQIRRRAEDQLRRSATELQATITKLHDSRLAALNMMEDADIARQQAEKMSSDLQREAAVRQRAEEELCHARDELELRVTERTKELAITVETLLEEMAEREKAEGRLYRLNRLYAVLSETDQAIVRAADKESLFHDISRIAVEQGGFILSWIGLVDEESSRVNIVAASGATAYLDEIRITVNEEPTGEGPTGIAIREGTYFICNDFLHAPCTSPWHEQGLAHGICASASVALKEEGRVIGALTLYAGVKDFFDQQHVDLLKQMGADVSFALDNFNREDRRRKTEQALREETLERLRAVEALREKDQLLLQQSRLAAMGEMINNIAHQWRQPLNVLGLNIQRTMLFYELGDFNGEFLQTSTDDAMKLIRHMSQTIDDFRNFFKTDKEKTLFSVNKAIQWTISLLKDGLNSDHIEIVAQNNGDPHINGYFNEFCQALLNIVQNARDVLVEQKVAAGTVSIISTVENNRTIVTITDNGGGVPEEIINRIYEPYFSTKGIQGTGIGLFMSKTIIETNMAGRITVRNTGQGAEFRIEI